MQNLVPKFTDFLECKVQLGNPTFWCHKGLRKPNASVLCRDGIHLNHKGQYALYGSYRGAILCALRSISLSLLSLSSRVDQLITPPAYFRSRLLPLSLV